MKVFNLKNFRLYSREVHKTTSEIKDTSFIRTLQVIPRVSIRNKGFTAVNRTHGNMPDIKLIIAQCHDKGVLYAAKGDHADMAATNTA